MPLHPRPLGLGSMRLGSASCAWRPAVLQGVAKFPNLQSLAQIPLKCPVRSCGRRCSATQPTDLTDKILGWSIASFGVSFLNSVSLKEAPAYVKTKTGKRMLLPREPPLHPCPFRGPLKSHRLGSARNNPTVALIQCILKPPNVSGKAPGKG